jgi:hypothetical protein
LYGHKCVPVPKHPSSFIYKLLHQWWLVHFSNCPPSWMRHMYNIFYLVRAPFPRCDAEKLFLSDEVLSFLVLVHTRLQSLLLCREG